MVASPFWLDGLTVTRRTQTGPLLSRSLVSVSVPKVDPTLTLTLLHTPNSNTMLQQSYLQRLSFAANFAALPAGP